MVTYRYNIINKIISWFDPKSPIFTARLSMLISALLSIWGITLGVREGSLAVQTNGFLSAVDILYSFIFIAAVRQSMRNPDYTFNYGYGKYESLFLLGAGSMLTGLLGFTLYDTILHYGDSTKLVGNRLLLIGFSVASALIMLVMHNLQYKAAKKYKLPALEFDAKMWRVDTIVEFGVIINLIIGYILENSDYSVFAKYIDSSTAIVLVAYALIFPIKGAKSAFNQLLDRTVDDEIQFNILATVVDNINNFCEFKSLHTRQSGKDLFIELDVVMPYDFTIEQKFDLEKKMRDSIKAKYPNSIPRMYVVPCEKDCIIDGKCKCPVKNNYKLKKD